MNRLRYDLFLAKKRIHSSVIYHQLPYTDLVVMKEEQEKERDWDQRMAREVLPETRLALKKLQAEHEKMKQELEDRRM